MSDDPTRVEPPRDFYFVDEVCARFGISQATFYRYKRALSLPPCVRELPTAFGRDRYAKQPIDDYFAGRETATRPALVAVRRRRG